MFESVDVAITTITSILIITSVVGNSLVCVVIMRNRDMRTPMNYLLVNLAVADIIYSAFLIPLLVLSHISTHPEGLAGRVLCTIRDGNFAWVGAASSVFTLAAIAAERYYAVIYPHGNKRKLTMDKLKVIIPGSWILALILSFPQFLKRDFVKDINHTFCSWPEEWIGKAYILAWLAFIVLSFALIVGLYSKVVYTLWFSSNGDNELTRHQKGVLKVRKRVTLMVVTVSGIFGICWSTDLTLHVLEHVAHYELSPVAILIAHTIIMLNTAVNPFAYALVNQRFREKIKRILCCGWWSSAEIHVADEARDIELVNATSHRTQPD